jgi:AraC-like DNA-binding protein
MKNYRMQKAAQMIRNKEGNITEIMYAVGFSSLSSFSKSFKSVFHVSPSNYQ